MASIYDTALRPSPVAGDDVFAFPPVFFVSAGAPDPAPRRTGAAVPAFFLLCEASAGDAAGLAETSGVLSLISSTSVDIPLPANAVFAGKHAAAQSNSTHNPVFIFIAHPGK